MIFSTFDTTDIVAGRIQPVSTGLFSDGTASWGGFFTSSAQTILSSSQYEPLNGLYYTNVYDSTGSMDSDTYFSVAYGNANGSGSSDFDTGSSLLFPTLAVYNQYRNLLLVPGDEQFTFASSSNNGIGYVGSNEIYVMSFAGTKMKDQLDPGQFQITLFGTTTASFIDDSPYVPNPTGQIGSVYNLIQGTLGAGPVQSNTYQAVGNFYPSLGVVIFNANAVQSLIGSGSFGGRTYSFNWSYSNWSGSFAQLQNVFFNAVAAGAQSSPMQARVTEYVPATHYFVRVKNQEYNYSNNPTFVSGSAGQIRFTDFYTDPKVYITGVGLYNDNNDLVAVAKLSQPLLKDFTNETLIKIKIDT
jgi:hypothetical protein